MSRYTGECEDGIDERGWEREMSKPIRAYGPPTAAKGDPSRRRAFDALVLGVLVAAGKPLAVSDINQIVTRQWNGARGPGGVTGALARLRDAGKVVAASRGNFREWRAA